MQLPDEVTNLWTNKMVKIARTCKDQEEFNRRTRLLLETFKKRKKMYAELQQIANDDPDVKNATNKLMIKVTKVKNPEILQEDIDNLTLHSGNALVKDIDDTFSSGKADVESDLQNNDDDDYYVEEIEEAKNGDQPEELNQDGVISELCENCDMSTAPVTRQMDKPYNARHKNKLKRKLTLPNAQPDLDKDKMAEDREDYEDKDKEPEKKRRKNENRPSRQNRKRKLDNPPENIKDVWYDKFKELCRIIHDNEEYSRYDTDVDEEPDENYDSDFEERKKKKKKDRIPENEMEHLPLFSLLDLIIRNDEIDSSLHERSLDRCDVEKFANMLDMFLLKLVGENPIKEEAIKAFKNIQRVQTESVSLKQIRALIGRLDSLFTKTFGSAYIPFENTESCENESPSQKQTFSFRKSKRKSALYGVLTRIIKDDKSLFESYKSLYEKRLEEAMTGDLKQIKNTDKQFQKLVNLSEMAKRAKKRAIIFKHKNIYHTDFIADMTAFKNDIQTHISDINRSNACSAYYKKRFRLIMLDWYATNSKEKYMELRSEFEHLIRELQLIDKMMTAKPALS